MTNGGARTEAEQVRPLSVWLPRGVIRNVEELAVMELTSPSNVIEDLVLEALARRAGAFDE